MAIVHLIFGIAVEPARRFDDDNDNEETEPGFVVDDLPNFPHLRDLEISQKLWGKYGFVEVGWAAKCIIAN